MDVDVHAISLLMFFVGISLLPFGIYAMSSGKILVKMVLVVCCFWVFISGFVTDPDSWPSSYYWEYHFSSALGRAIGTWLGTSLIIGAFAWLTMILCIFCLVRNKITASKVASMAKRQSTSSYLIQAMNELETNNVDKLTWAKAIIAADGDETKAKAEYLKLRRNSKN